MSEKPSKNTALPLDFRAVKRRRAIHLWAQALLAITLMLMLNYIAAHYFLRKDLTQTHRYTLAPETQQYLNALNETVQIYVLVPEDDKNQTAKKIRTDIENLLREYTYSSMVQGKPKVTADFVDIYRQRARARELSNRFNITREALVIVVASGDRYREILGTDLYVSKDGRLVGFKGESVFTEAILDVTQKEPNKIYFSVGHGEMRPNDTNNMIGLSQLGFFLQQRNITVDLIDLTAVSTVPEDADLVILAAPQRPLRTREEDILREYLSAQNGKLFVMLRTGSNAGIDELLYEWGILADNMAVVGKNEDFKSQSGDTIIRHFSEHPMTEFLVSNQLPIIMGLTQSVRPDPGAPNDDRLKTTILLASPGKDAQTGELLSWAEPYWALKNKPHFDPDIDLPGPVSVGVLAQRQVKSGLGLDIPGGKLIVFGNADFVANNYFQSLGNSILMHNIINWCMEREDRLNIPPRKLTAYKLTLSQDEVQSISFRLALIPILIGLLGVIIIWTRRR